MATTNKVIGLWMDDVGETGKAWIVSRDALGDADDALTRYTVALYECDDEDGDDPTAYELAKKYAHELARKEGLRVVEKRRAD